MGETKVVGLIRTQGLRLLSLAMLWWLSACSAPTLLGDVVLSADAYNPATDPVLTVSYQIRRAATVDIALTDAQGRQFDLRRDQARAAAEAPYVLRFDGSVPIDDGRVIRRLLEPGAYELVVTARAVDGRTQQQRLPVTITGEQLPLPAVEDLLAVPSRISPNADAIDDVVEFTYRLPISATVDISVRSADGEQIPIVTREQEGPFLQQHVWNGKRPNGSLLAAGIYTYTVRAEDRFGNIVQEQGTLELTDVGQPEARIVYSSIAPERVMLGEVVTVTMHVRNTGTVPIRTYGPPSGYEYSTEDVFSSVDDGAYTAQAGGFWRIGVDWDANSGGGAKRYPYRWAVSPREPADWAVPFVEDFLMPGEEAVVIGRIRVLQRETRMGFYVGLIQDGVGFFQDRTGRTIVEVGF
jgi:hypothetical protein